MVDDRKQRLADFVAWASEHISGDEKGQAQIFLDHLFQALGHKGSLDVGGTPEFRVRKGREAGGGVAFADYVWKPYVLIEMKKRGEDLTRHYRQAFDYWVQLVPGRPRYVILCNFDEIWVFDFETQMDTPVDRLPLSELPERDGPLAFLFPTPQRPVFGNDHEEVTRRAADLLAVCFNKLIIRKVPRETAQRFALQMLVALFAEDIGLLEKYFVVRLLEECKGPADSYELLGGLFKAMNSPVRAAGGRFKGVDYFNGGLFKEPAMLDLHDDELNQLRQAAKSDWSKVRPEIFGALFEHSLEKEERHAYGGHFTRPTDIMKIVGPTIVEPWRNLIENATTLTELEKLRNRMTNYHVLDPACGSGNFLYIAYREVKRLEARLFERIEERKKDEKGQRQIGFVHANQFFGIDINPFAVEIAKVTMMIARKLAIDELHIHEPALPLDRLDENFIAGDALITPFRNGEPFPTMLFAELDEDPWAVGRIAPAVWPKADVIIGNPPFLGAKRLRPERGADYINAVRRTFPQVPGMADYCVYWLRLAHDHLPECTPDDPIAGRAGLVGTQNIRNNQSRVGGLDHIVQSGTIIEAVDNQPWSGEANVHVSIVNWVKTKNVRLLPKQRRLWYKVDPPQESSRIRKRGEGPAAKEYDLKSRACSTINAALSDRADVTGAKILRCNTDPQRVFQGQVPGHDAFILQPREAMEFFAKDRKNRKVIHPFLIGRDVVTGDGRPTRWVIDFHNMSVIDAGQHTAPFDRIKRNVLPVRRTRATTGATAAGKKRPHHQLFLRFWWRHSYDRPEMIRLIRKMPRYVACSGVTKRPIFNFIASSIRPDHAVFVFAFPDDYSFGILQSYAHWLWFITKCSKLTERFRYTPPTVFNTFPWPQRPTKKRIREVAEAALEVRQARKDALQKTDGGLRAVYRMLELPGDNPLKVAHAALDEAVMEAYGFSSDGDLLKQLLDLNLSVAERIERGESVTAPGIPPDYPKPKELITDDCIRP
ncbi:MAG: DNA methyltransferase [Planctomycetota bacterium]